MLSFICEICNNTFPVSLHHEHHKIPKALGGSDERSNLANLCHSDHNNLHLLAYMLVNPKRRHEFEPTLVSIFPHNLEARKKLLEFSNLVAKEISLKKEIRKEADQEVRVIIELPARYSELLRLLGYDLPRANGKPSGVAKVVRNIIAETLATKFPLLREEILGLRKKK